MFMNEWIKQCRYARYQKFQNKILNKTLIIFYKNCKCYLFKLGDLNNSKLQ